THLERDAEGTYQDEIIDLLVATAELDYPDVLVDRDIDRLIDQESNHASHTEEGLRAWLEAIGRSEEDVRDSLREGAELNVRRALALGELVSAEGIEVQEQDVDDEIDRLVAQMSGGAEVEESRRQAVRQLFDTPEG